MEQSLYFIISMEDGLYSTSRTLTIKQSKIECKQAELYIIYLETGQNFFR